MALIRETDKKCVLCKHWNGAIGSTTIHPKPGRVYEFDQNEKQPCYVKRFDTVAQNICPKFESRYK